MEDLKSKGIDMHIIPNYSREIAPVELYFSVLKKYLFTASKDEQLI